MCDWISRRDLVGYEFGMGSLHLKDRLSWRDANQASSFWPFGQHLADQFHQFTTFSNTLLFLFRCLICSWGVILYRKLAGDLLFLEVGDFDLLWRYDCVFLPLSKLLRASWLLLFMVLSWLLPLTEKGPNLSYWLRLLFRLFDWLLYGYRWWLLFRLNMSSLWLIFIYLFDFGAR